MINFNENEAENKKIYHIETTQINLGLYMVDTNIL